MLTTDSQPESAPMTRCSTCKLGGLCVAAGSDRQTLSQLDAMLSIDDRIAAGDDPIRRGDAFTGLLAVRSGYFKSYLIDREGNEQVQGFHFPGELIGLDAIQGQVHRANVKALSDAALCHLDYAKLTSLSSCSNALQQQLFRLFSGKLSDQHWRAVDFTAEERISAFILDISERLERRGFDGTVFELKMARSDIGNYLALATETVSRIFSRLKSARLIDVQRKRVTLLDVDGLRRIAKPVFESR